MRPPAVGAGRATARSGTSRVPRAASHSTVAREPVVCEHDHLPVRLRVREGRVEVWIEVSEIAARGEQCQRAALVSGAGRAHGNEELSLLADDSLGSVSGPDGLDGDVAEGVDLRERAGELVAHPDRSARDGDPVRAVTDLDRGTNGVGGGIDSRDRAVEAVCDPDRAEPDSDRIRATPGTDRAATSPTVRRGRRPSAHAHASRRPTSTCRPR